MDLYAMNNLLRGNALFALERNQRHVASASSVAGRRSLHPADKDPSVGTPILGVAST